MIKCRLISQDILKKLKNKKNDILIIGLTFKENCNDTRNSLVPILYKYLNVNNNVQIFDPLVNKEYFNSKNIKFTKVLKKNKYNAIILAVPHTKIMKLGQKKIETMLKKQSFIYDLKGLKKNKKIESFKMNILIGAGGFIGNNLTDYLYKKRIQFIFN